MRYPILPKIRLTGSRQAREQILEIRHSSLYCPRDFDISPYFNVVKPTIAKGFDYKALHWAGQPHAPDSAPELAVALASVSVEAGHIPLAPQPAQIAEDARPVAA